MGIEFLRPLLWLVLPVALAALFLMERRFRVKRTVRKHKIARVTRVLLIFLLVAALAGPALLLPGNRASTWALCDLSASTVGQKAFMESALAAGLANAEADLAVGAIAFGRTAMVDAPLAQGRALISLGTKPDGGGTDIAHALQMAMALLPEDAAGRIALLSDGRDNVGNVAYQLAALKARDIPVDVLTLPNAVTNDAQVSQVLPPAQVYQREKFDVTVRLYSNYDTTGTLILYANRSPAATREITLRKGENSFVFQDIATASGVVTYEAQLVAQGDENQRNNRLGAYMDVRGVPKVLVVGSGAELSQMLNAAGMETEIMQPGQLPDTAEALRQYHAIALCNVAIDAISDQSLTALSDYVRKLGRGLCVFGGDDSYALGGWRGTLLEEMLPVTMDVDNRLQMPSLSLVLIIDKSGSMTEGRFGITRLEMAKEAAMRSAEVLTARDQVGVIAFDDTAKWVVPMQQVTDVASIQEMIGTIRPGGGTAFYSALSQGLAALMESETQLKHVIFLTDGEPGDSGYESVVQQMAANGITLTTVAVGSGANASMLSKLAKVGGGRAYTAGEFDDIPKLFTKETYLATQAYVQNRTFFPVILSTGPLTDYDAFPAVHGYLATTAKPLSTVALATDQEDPLLAWWQYGAGRALCWTSDVSGAWTGDFLRWDQAAAFFSGMISHVLPAEAGEGELTLTRQGQSVALRYATPDETAGLTTEATILSPDGTEEKIALSATAPGVFEGMLLAEQEGAYAVRVEQRQGETLVRTLESGVAVGYSPEFDLRTPDGASLLAQIASETGGRMLTDPAQLFTERGHETRARRDLSTLLLIVALVLFVLDAAQRRLAWESWIPQKTREEKQRVEGAKKTEKPSTTVAKTPESLQPASVTDTAEKLLAGRKKKLL